MSIVKYESTYTLADTFEPPQQLDWELYRETKFELSLDIVDDQQQAIDLTGWCGELIIEYIQAYDSTIDNSEDASIVVPEKGNIITYKLIANRISDTIYFNTKYANFIIDDINGNIKFTLTSSGTSKDNTDGTYHGSVGTRFTQTEGPLLCNDAKYELRFKYIDAETNEASYIRPLFGNISFVDNHISTENKLPCELKIETPPTIIGVDADTAGDPTSYVPGDNLILNSVNFELYNNLTNIFESGYIIINENKFLLNKNNIPLLPKFNDAGNEISYIDLTTSDLIVVEGDEIKVVILTDSGQQLVSNTFVVGNLNILPRTLYYNHSSNTGSWNNLSYWFDDETFQTQAIELPKSIDSVIITSSVNFPNPVTVYSLTVNGPQFGDSLIYRVDTTAHQMTFNGNTIVKSNLTQPITSSENIIFNDNSEAGGNIIDTIPERITIDNVNYIQFNDNSKNYAFVNSANFYDDAQNASSLYYDNITLTLPLEGSVTKANFYNNSKNYGTIGSGILIFNRSTGIYKSPNYRSRVDKTFVNFYDNSCHYGDLSKERLPSVLVYISYETGYDIVLDYQAIRPYPPPICSF